MSIEETMSNLESWSIKNDSVKLSISKQGGQMAPVKFYTKELEAIMPYYINPWHAENLKIDVGVLKPLRGDFFCLPFGGNNCIDGEKIDVHGEPSYKEWTFESSGKVKDLTSLQLSMKIENPKGKITKRIKLKDSQNVVYIQHELNDFDINTSIGHHAILNPQENDGGMLISTSPIRFGMTSPRGADYTADSEYYATANLEKFDKLENVPTIWKSNPHTDCSVFPKRKGFTDIIAVFSNTNTPLAWTCAVFPGKKYLWFSIKDPNILPSTAIWMENYGRHQFPWNSRNCCIGLEEVCGYFANGHEDSNKENILNSQGIKTSIALSKDKNTFINNIQGVVKIPNGFDKVKKVEFELGKAAFYSESNQVVTSQLDSTFIKTGVIS